jgi:hypothetical protein
LEVSVYPGIAGKDLVCPCDRIGHTDSRRLWACPEFQVLCSVVVLHTIAMMDRLLGEHVAAKYLLHDQDVLKDVPALAGSRMPGRPDHDIASFVAGAASLPAAIRGPGHGAAVGAGG